jgi:hypothetical protein
MKIHSQWNLGEGTYCFVLFSIYQSPDFFCIVLFNLCLEWALSPLGISIQEGEPVGRKGDHGSL